MTAVLFSFKDGRRDLFGNTTFVLPSQNPEIALFSPILSPAVYIGQRSFNACTDFKSVSGVFNFSPVLHKPVRFLREKGLLCTVTNQKNSCKESQKNNK